MGKLFDTLWSIFCGVLLGWALIHWGLIPLKCTSINDDGYCQIDETNTTVRKKL